MPEARWEKILRENFPDLYDKFRNDKGKLASIAILAGVKDPELEEFYDRYAKSKFGSNPINTVRDIQRLMQSAGSLGAPVAPAPQPQPQPQPQPSSGLQAFQPPPVFTKPPGSSVAVTPEETIQDVNRRISIFGIPDAADLALKLRGQIGEATTQQAPTQDTGMGAFRQAEANAVQPIVPGQPDSSLPPGHPLSPDVLGRQSLLGGQPQPVVPKAQTPVVAPQAPKTAPKPQQQQKPVAKGPKIIEDMWRANEQFAGQGFTKTGAEATVLKIPQGANAGKYAVVPKRIGLLEYDRITAWAQFGRDVMSGGAPVFDNEADARKAAAELNRELENRFKAKKSTGGTNPVAALDAAAQEEATKSYMPEKKGNTKASHYESFGLPKDAQMGGQPLIQLYDFAQRHGFEVTSGLATSGHNKGSKHYTGRAIDVRTSDKSPEEIDAFIKAARAAGFKVVDERTRPKGQKVWTGPHLHLEYVDGGMGAMRLAEAAIDRKYLESLPPTQRVNYRFEQLRRQIMAATPDVTGTTPYEEWSAAMTGYQRVTAATRRVATMIEGLLKAIADEPMAVQAMNDALGIDLKEVIGQELRGIGYDGPIPEMNEQGLRSLLKAVKKAGEYGHEMVAKLAKNPPNLTSADKLNYFGLSRPQDETWLADRTLVAVALYGERGSALDKFINFALSPSQDKGFWDGVGRVFAYPVQWFAGELDKDAQRQLREVSKVLDIGADFRSTEEAVGFAIAREGAESAPTRWDGISSYDPNNKNHQLYFRSLVGKLEQRFGVKFQKDTSGLADVDEVRQFLYKKYFEHDPQSVHAAWDQSYGPIVIDDPGIAIQGWYRAWRFLNIFLDIPSIMYSLGAGRPVMLGDSYQPGVIENTAFFVGDMAGTVALALMSGGLTAAGEAAAKGATRVGARIAEKTVAAQLEKQGISRAISVGAGRLALGTIGNPRVMAQAVEMGLVFGVQEAAEELTDQLATGSVDIGPILYAGISSFFLGAVTGGMGVGLAKAAPWIVKGTGGFVSPKVARWAAAIGGETAIFANLQPTIESYYSEDGLHYVPPSGEDWYEAFIMVGMAKTLGRINDPDIVMRRLADAAAKGKSEMQAEAAELLKNLDEEERASFVQKMKEAFAKVQVRSYVQNAFSRMRTAFNRTARDNPADEPRRAPMREAIRRMAGDGVNWIKSRADAAVDYFKNNPRLVKNRQNAEYMRLHGITMEEELALIEAIQNPLIVKRLMEMGVDVEALRARAKVLGLWDNNYIPFVVHSAKWWEVAAEAFKRATGLHMRDLMAEDDTILIAEEINARKVLGVGVDPGEAAREEALEKRKAEIREEVINEVDARWKEQLGGKKPNKEQRKQAIKEVEEEVERRVAEEESALTDVDIAKPGMYKFDGEKLVYMGDTIPHSELEAMKPLYNMALAEYTAEDAGAMKALEEAGLLEPEPDETTEPKAEEDLTGRAKARHEENGASRDATRNESAGVAELSRILVQDTGLTPEDISDYVSAGAENEVLDTVFENMRRQLEKAGVKIEMSAKGKSATINGRRYSVTGERGAILTAWNLLRNDALPEVPKEQAKKAKTEPPKPKEEPKKPEEGQEQEQPKAEEEPPKEEQEKPKEEQEPEQPKKEPEAEQPKAEQEKPKVEEDKTPPKEEPKPKKKPKKLNIFRKLAGALKGAVEGAKRNKRRNEEIKRKAAAVEEANKQLKSEVEQVNQALDKHGVTDQEERKRVEEVSREHFLNVRNMLGKEPGYSPHDFAEYMIGKLADDTKAAVIESDARQLISSLSHVTAGRFEVTDEGVRFADVRGRTYYYLSEDGSWRSKIEAMSYVIRQIGFENPELYHRLAKAIPSNEVVMPGAKLGKWNPGADNAIVISKKGAPEKAPAPKPENKGPKKEDTEDKELVIIDPVDEVTKRLPKSSDKDLPEFREDLTLKEAEKSRELASQAESEVDASILKMRERIVELNKEIEAWRSGKRQFNTIEESTAFAKQAQEAIHELNDQISKLLNSRRRIKEFISKLDEFIKKKRKEQEAEEKKKKKEEEEAIDKQVNERKETAERHKTTASEAIGNLGKTTGALTTTSKKLGKMAYNLLREVAARKLYETEKAEGKDITLKDARNLVTVDVDSYKDVVEMAEDAIRQAEEIEYKGNSDSIASALDKVNELQLEYERLKQDVEDKVGAFKDSYGEYKSLAEQHGREVNKVISGFAEELDARVEAALNAQSVRESRTPFKDTETEKRAAENIKKRVVDEGKKKKAKTTRANDEESGGLRSLLGVAEAEAEEKPKEKKKAKKEPEKPKVEPKRKSATKKAANSDEGKEAAKKRQSEKKKAKDPVSEMDRKASPVEKPSQKKGKNDTKKLPDC